MARNPKLHYKRNERIRKRYADLEKRFPNYKYSAIIDMLVEEYFLATSTIIKILNNN